MKLTKEDKRAIKYLLQKRIAEIRIARKKAKEDGAVLHYTQEVMLCVYSDLLKRLK